MKAEYINPFVESVKELFGSMLDCHVVPGKMEVSGDDEGDPVIIGLIGLSGTGQGIIAIKLPIKTALSIVGKLVGMKFDKVDSTVIDGVGELVNIIAGNAKTKFQGHKISLSLPTVVRGNIFKLQNLGKLLWLSVPFDSELGDFSIEVSFKPVAKSVEEIEDASVGSR
ncbi:MAG: hypothetical protein GY855_12830 [candidate division Zixibacteria bacterium]|nr:hypothetical protein [candidate division Zixibacteria bacterium]